MDGRSMPAHLVVDADGRLSAELSPPIDRVLRRIHTVSRSVHAEGTSATVGDRGRKEG